MPDSRPAARLTPNTANAGSARSESQRSCDVQPTTETEGLEVLVDALRSNRQVAAIANGNPDPWLGGDIEQALDSIGVPTWVIDDHARLRWENAKARELIGQARGRRIISFFARSEQPRVEVEVARKLLGGSATSDYRTI